MTDGHVVSLAICALGWFGLGLAIGLAVRGRR